MGTKRELVGKFELLRRMASPLGEAHNVYIEPIEAEAGTHYVRVESDDDRPAASTARFMAELERGPTRVYVRVNGHVLLDLAPQDLGDVIIDVDVEKERPSIWLRQRITRADGAVVLATPGFRVEEEEHG